MGQTLPKGLTFNTLIFFKEFFEKKSFAAFERKFSETPYPLLVCKTVHFFYVLNTPKDYKFLERSGTRIKVKEPGGHPFQPSLI